MTVINGSPWHAKQLVPSLRLDYNGIFRHAAIDWNSIELAPSPIGSESMSTRPLQPFDPETPRDVADKPSEMDDIVREFVEHWGLMARSWGINATMGELFALLYITGSDWTADDLRRTLDISRGNVSMNLRELMAWGVVHRVHRTGERREFYRAEADVWTLFRRILSERKRRELDPTLVVLDRTAVRTETDPMLKPLHDRVVSLQQFFGLINLLATRLSHLEPGELEDLRLLFEDPPKA
jgi:DNA-binding transcriptional regulator GbsR (MarR family)